MIHEVQKIADGAYFVPCYSEQTVVHFQPIVTAQAIVGSQSQEDEAGEPLEMHDDTDPDSA